MALASPRRRYRLWAASLALLATCIAPQPSLAQGNRWLAAARTLRLDSLPGSVTTYFSSGQRARAQTLQRDTREALSYFRDSLGVGDTTVHIAVIDRRDWPAFMPAQFYGVASSVGPRPWTLLMTATGEGTMAQMLEGIRPRVSPATWATLDSSGRSIPDLVLREMDMAIVHEYGHILGRDLLGIRWGKEWFQEFLANYLMWSFLSARYPERARAYAAFDAVVSEGAMSPPTQLTVYESGLSAMIGRGDQSSVMWFHASIGQRVRACYARRGLGLVRDVQRLLPRSAGWGLEDEKLLPILDSICAGFTRWAADMRLSDE